MCKVTLFPLHFVMLSKECTGNGLTSVALKIYSVQEGTIKLPPQTKY